MIVRLDDRVLPVRDPEPVKVRLALEQALLHLHRRRRGDEAGHQVLGAFVEGAERRAVGVAGDPAVVRVGRVRGDARQLQRAAVHPPVVPVAVGQEHRAIRDGPVEVLAPREPARKVGERPAAAQDPRDLGVRRGVGRDPAHVVVDPLAVEQVAVDAVDAGRDRVDVGVPEPGVTVRPRRSMTRVDGPASSMTSRSPPTATIRLPRTATARAQLVAASAVNTAPPVRTRSARSVDVMARGCTTRNGSRDGVAPCGVGDRLRR